MFRNSNRVWLRPMLRACVCAFVGVSVVAFSTLGFTQSVGEKKKSTPSRTAIKLAKLLYICAVPIRRPSSSICYRLGTLTRLNPDIALSIAKQVSDALDEIGRAERLANDERYKHFLDKRAYKLGCEAVVTDGNQPELVTLLLAGDIKSAKASPPNPKDCNNPGSSAVGEAMNVAGVIRVTSKDTFNDSMAAFQQCQAARKRNSSWKVGVPGYKFGVPETGESGDPAPRAEDKQPTKDEQESQTYDSVDKCKEAAKKAGKDYGCAATETAGKSVYTVVKAPAPAAKDKPVVQRDSKAFKTLKRVSNKAANWFIGFFNVDPADPSSGGHGGGTRGDCIEGMTCASGDRCVELAKQAALYNRLTIEDHKRQVFEKSKCATPKERPSGEKDTCRSRFVVGGMSKAEREELLHLWCMAKIGNYAMPGDESGARELCRPRLPSVAKKDRNVCNDPNAMCTDERSAVLEIMGRPPTIGPPSGEGKK